MTNKRMHRRTDSLTVRKIDGKTTDGKTADGRTDGRTDGRAE